MKQEFSTVAAWLRTFGRAAIVAIPVCGLLLLIAKFKPAPLEIAPKQPAAVANMKLAQLKGQPAKDITGGVAWLNTKKPLSLPDLRGRIVLLDFWTLCCINCIHVLPDLARLEAKYPGLLVVIGVHSPKFPNEAKTESVAKAVLRYNIKHPVINDAEMRIWRRYDVESWPTLVLIDPDGNYYGHVNGEGNFNVLDQHIGKLADEFRAKKLLKETPLNFELIKEKDHGPLNFPGKVLADARSNRLFIADSTNNRIVITDLAGKKIAVAGSGIEGLKNGPFATAQFSDPQGMALDGDTLYVADRKNHSIRALDLKKQTVSLAAGTGEQSHQRDGGPARMTGLNSPWDLLIHDGKIFIAMAGHHQIWVYDLRNATVEPFAGNGRENIADGPLNDSCFAQPSGLASDGKNLYVADSETSSVRSMPINGAGLVKTIVGEHLFKFGDKDGVGPEVRLQHALGVAHRDGLLYIADTYNSKIKAIDPNKRSCRTFLGDGSTKTFFEPAGLSFAGDKLYVADTNNHRIQVVDMTSKKVETLVLSGVEPVAAAQAVEKMPPQPIEKKKEAIEKKKGSANAP